MKSSIVLLGSTGSIGRATLKICKKYNIKVEALVANNNTKLLQEQIEEFKPNFVVVGSKEKAKEIKHQKIFIAKEGILKVINLSKSNLVVNALVGYFGLFPTLEAIKIGKKVALANKESLVVAGAFIDTSKITPIDSEHFGLKYLLDCSLKTPKRLIITASGGAFRNWEIKNIQKASLKDALNHPNWAMGEKITIDSATMVNKLFEILEARWLFGVEDIDGVIEEKSLIHALVEFIDGSSTAHFATTSMELPIAYAILEKVEDQILKNLNLLEIGKIEFKKIDSKRYPVWEIKEDLLKNPKSGLILNSANEAALKEFMEGKIAFGEISKAILKAFKKFEKVTPSSLDDVPKIDKEVRNFVQSYLKRG